MQTLNDKLISYLEEHGLKARIVDFGHAVQLIEELEERHTAGQLDKALFKKYFARYREKFGSNGEKNRSLVVIAVPQPAGRLEFALDGGNCSVIIPPTYVYGEIDAKVEELFGKFMEPLGYSFERPVLPYKLLAVRSGLGSYGRNNICYVPGFGSLHRLVVFGTSMPCEKDSWQEAGFMEKCGSCGICARVCPTKCITDDRQLIHAESCMTYLNENVGEFPEWLKSGCHNAIVGCIECQAACPENKGRLKDAQLLDSFTAEETGLILAETPFRELPQTLADKLERLCLAEYYDVLPRNLKVLINKM